MSEEFPVNESPKDRAMLPPADAKLSLPPRRLAGSARCLNCGTVLQGPFCHYCGQPDKNLMRFFPVLMRELLEDFLDFDSRFMRTIKPLLFHPGKLTRDYLDGRRFRYVPPLRLYLFSSIVFFFLAAVLSTTAVHINGNGEDDLETGIQFGVTDRQELEEMQQGLPPEAADKVGQAMEKALHGEGEADSAEADEDLKFTVKGKPWDRETNPVVVPGLPDRLNDWINDEIENSPQKGREIAANPGLMKDKILDVLPATMFILLPLVALLFKFWYLFARRYYVEHLIFALHNHAFIFVVFILSMLLSALADWLDPSGEQWVSVADSAIGVVLLAWVPLYLLLSLRRVYRQGWGMTLGKYVAIGLSYSVLLTVATVIVAVLGFVLV